MGGFSRLIYCRVGDNVWVGSGVELSDQSVVGRGCVFLNGTRIGERSTIGDGASFKTGAEVGDYTLIGDRCKFDGLVDFGRGVKIGDGAIFLKGSIVLCRGDVEFGDGTIFYTYGVFLGDAKFGDNCMIGSVFGSDLFFMGDVSIGENCRVGKAYVMERDWREGGALVHLEKYLQRRDEREAVE